MRDYISKPTNSDKLEKTLMKWTQTSSENANSRPQDVTVFAKPEATPAIDLKIIASLKELVDEDDPDFLRDLLEEYLNNTTGSIKDLRRAIESEDAVTVAETAHSLKGASSNIGAKNMAKLYEGLETIAKAQSLDEAPDYLSDLEREFRHVKAELAPHVCRK